MVVTININIDEDRCRELCKLIKNLCGGIEVETKSEIKTEKKVSKSGKLVFTENSLREYLEKALRTFDCPTHYNGFKYVIEAIYIGIFNPADFELVTKTLYPSIAKKFGTTASRVEGAIRCYIEQIWATGNREQISKIFKCDASVYSGKPTNSEFLYEIRNAVEWNWFEIELS